MATNLSQLIEFYDSLWGLWLCKSLQPFWSSSGGQPTLALGFGLPWGDAGTLYAIPTQYGGRGIVWPLEGECQTFLVDPFHLPIDDRSINVVWAMHMFDEMSDDWLKEVARVLKPGGALHFVVAKPWHPLTRSWPLPCCSKRALVRRLDAAGWQVRVRSHMGFPSMLWYVRAHKKTHCGVRANPDGSLVLMKES